VRWSEVAAWSRLPFRSDAQFHSIALSEVAPDTPPPWQGHGPILGSLYPPDAENLTRFLREWTSTPEQCWFCLWDGYGWENRQLLVPIGEPAESLSDPVPQRVRKGPRVHSPGRDYLHFYGPVEAAMATVHLADSNQTPNLWWPQDQAWCVASEIDLPWTYAGGSPDMIDRLLADESIEAIHADPDDRISRVDHAVNELLTSGVATITTSSLFDLPMP
jgi:hypothetical protein